MDGANAPVEESIRHDACHGFLDNGAFTDWRMGRQFDVRAFAHDLVLADAAAVQPDFIVVPDIVAGGLSSLALSLKWQKGVSSVGKAYLAVQDGMSLSEVRDVLPLFDGIFVGGTLEWKLLSGKSWVELAHSFSKPCHIGRVGTPGRLIWARKIKADSIDSCLPLFSTNNLRRFRSGLFYCID